MIIDKFIISGERYIMISKDIDMVIQ